MKFENENWAQFKGETWKKEINVRDFIQNNYKPYNGDDTFLVTLFGENEESVEQTNRDV